MLAVVESGLVYRNPKPYLRAIHAWHPSLVRFDDGELVASFDLGQAVEALDYATHLARSTDGGQTWSPPARLFHETLPRPTSHSVRISRTRDGSLLAAGARFYRDDAEEGLVNRANLGYVEIDLIQLASADRGRSWTGPLRVEPPLVGPAFETCHGIVELRDGRWLWPTCTWRGWHGDAPHGMQAIALVSHDQGKTWPEYLRVLDGTADQVIYWEQSLVQLADGRLLSVAWAFHEPSGTSRPNQYALSADGRTFSPPQPSGTHGQTAKLLALSDGRLLCLYRRESPAGLWGELFRIEGDRWVRLEEQSLWTGAAAGMRGAGTNSDELSALKFGYPQMVQLDARHALAVFWCLEEGVQNIRWLRLQVA